MKDHPIKSLTFFMNYSNQDVLRMKNLNLEIFKKEMVPKILACVSNQQTIKTIKF